MNLYHDINHIVHQFVYEIGGTRFPDECQTQPEGQEWTAAKSASGTARLNGCMKFTGFTRF